ncbi:EAL domain-containing protein [Bacillus marasmi]|uniref:EAL domain-containing protein n=1 Tax=Bacillus marasmi TaxID=1926279 RepID=UPI0011CA4630|nr:EAL domain-containing protein [Bacillus marasmi]
MSYMRILRNIFINDGIEKWDPLEQSAIVMEKGGPLIENFERKSKLNIEQILSIMFNETLILITNTKGVITYVNEKCCETLGYTSNELLGSHTRIFNAGQHSREFYQRLWKTLLKGKSWTGEMTAKRKDGSFGWYHMSIFPLFDDAKKLYGFLTLRTDITEQKSQQKHVLLQDAITEMISDELFGCIDENNNLVSINTSIKKVFGYNTSDVIGKNVIDILKEENVLDYMNWFEKLKSNPGSKETLEIIVKNKNGSYSPYEITAKNMLHDPIINAIVFVKRNITKQKDLSNRMERIEYFDWVTGLPNRKSFAEILSKELRLAMRGNKVFAIAKIGIDDFKYVNNTFGFNAGNQLLVDFSKSIMSALNRKDCELYRASGDEFFMIMRNIEDQKDIPKKLALLYQHLNRKPFEINGAEIYLSASMGVSIFPSSGDNADALLKNAETALYDAKSKGKNQYQIFSPTMDFNSYKQFTLRNDCKKAVLRDEFLLHFQPRFNPITDEMVSAEALIRWNHKKFGLVSPGEFIHMAEESGLIIPIGEWIIKKVCEQIKLWEHSSLPIKKISINLSTIQLLQPNFVDMVVMILKDKKVDSRWVEFEITESVVIKNEKQVLTTLNKLRGMGITIALDDFGTGYSSLHYLKKIPCEIIKLDKSLVDEIHQDRDHYEIIASTIQLCHKLGKSVVAEGVETTEQLSLLKALSCDEIQGYYYSKPLDGHHFRKWLTNSKWKKKDVKAGAVNFNVNRRNYARVQLNAPVLAEMTIVSIGKSQLKLGSSPVSINNISPVGLCFDSSLNLPVKRDIILQFKTIINKVEVTFKGYIVWTEELSSNYKRYGVTLLQKIEI